MRPGDRARDRRADGDADRACWNDERGRNRYTDAGTHHYTEPHRDVSGLRIRAAERIRDSTRDGNGRTQPIASGNARARVMRERVEPPRAADERDRTASCRERRGRAP